MDKLLHRPQTMLEVYKLLPEGTPIQLINNRLYMSPAPSFIHFDTIKKIFKQLENFIEEHQLGTLVFAPVDVYLGTDNAVQPDIFFIANNNASIIQQNGVYGAPNFIIEVLSVGNKNDDLVKKKNVYEKYCIAEYFIVDPTDKTVISYLLKQKKYELQKSSKGKIKVKQLKLTIQF